MKTRKITYCKYCGGEINESKKCIGCGKQYFKFPKITPLKILLIICIIIIFGLSYFCYSEAVIIIKMTSKIQNLEETLEISESNYSELKNQYTKLETDYTELNNEYKITKTNCEHYKKQVTKYSEYRDTAYYWNQYGALTIPNNNRYHTHSCKRLQNAETIYVCTVWDAEDMGYTPCPYCH